jgi:hypothetical protein
MVDITEFHNLLDKNKWSEGLIGQGPPIPNGLYNRGTWNIPITEGKGILRKVRFRNFESVPYTQYAMAKKETVEITIKPNILQMKSGVFDAGLPLPQGYMLFIDANSGSSEAPEAPVMLPIGETKKTLYVESDISKFVSNLNDAILEWEDELPVDSRFVFMNPYDSTQPKYESGVNDEGIIQHPSIHINNDLTFDETVLSLTADVGETTTFYALMFTISVQGHPISNIYSSESASIFYMVEKINGVLPDSDDIWNISNVIGLYQSTYFINTEKKLLDFLYNEPRFIVHCVQSNSDTKAVLASNIQNYSDVPIVTIPTNRFISIYITDQNNNLIDVFGEHSYMLDWYIAWFIRIDFVYELI